MRDLWRSTVSVLRQHPILWIPVAIVEFADFILHWLENIFRQWLIQKLLLRMSEEHSVLSNSPIYGAPTQHAINKAIILVVPLGWCVQLLYNLLLTFAIVATAAILQRIAETGTGTLRDAITAIKSSIRRILVFAFTLFGLNVIGQVITSILAALIRPIDLNHLQSRLVQILSLSVRAQIALEQSNLISNLFANLWPLPITLCVVYIIAQFQVRLLLPPDTNPTAQQVRSSRIVWLLAIIVSTLATFAAMLLHVFLSSVLQPSNIGIIHLYEAVIRIKSIAIYAALFIAIYLIAYPQSPLAIPPIQPITPPDELDPPSVEEAP